jgi:hypothetical protein
MAGHLKRSSTTGHLLRNAAGHLVNDCGVSPPVNTCNSCDPPIPDTLYVTLAGLGGNFAIWNGKWKADWLDTCRWMFVDAPGNEGLIYVSTGGGWWDVSLSTITFCGIVFKKTANPCAPQAGTYSQTYCVDSGCSDTGSCESSVNATCVVSLT